MIDYLYKMTVPWAKANKAQLLRNRILGRIANYIYPFEYKSFSKNRDCVPNVIVSLTSFPARIERLHLCIGSLLNQDIIPERIILWLAESQFPEKRIPLKLQELTNDLFEVRYCPDYKSYKKILPTIDKYKNKIIVTADDDVIYPTFWLSELLNTASQYPDCIICHRASRIVFDEENKIGKYRDWVSLSPDFKGPSNELVAIGVGGILYPAGFFEGVDLDYDIIRLICPTADDLWLKIIELKKGTRIVKVKENSTEWFTIIDSQNEVLTKVNVLNGQNDILLENLINYYHIDTSTMRDIDES